MIGMRNISANDICFDFELIANYNMIAGFMKGFTMVFPRINISFAPAWWHHYYGMDFDRAFWQDPIARTERGREQQRLLFERFSDVGLGEADPQPHPVAGDAYGHRFMSAFWGCEVAYVTDQFPSAVTLPNADQRLRHLRVPNVEESPVVQQLRMEYRQLVERYGHCEAVVNFGGPLNNAVSVLGSEIYIACKTEPDLARLVLQNMGEAVLAIHDQVVCPLNGLTAAMAHSQAFGIGNCPVGTISPHLYQQVVLPADLWLRQQFGDNFNLHHCGIFDAYTEAYLPLRPSTLDLGPGSNLRLARAVYPDTPITTYLEVGGLIRITRQRLDDMLLGLVADAAPMCLFPEIMVAEAGPEVSDETVRDLLTAQDRLSRLI